MLTLEALGRERKEWGWGVNQQTSISGRTRAARSWYFRESKAGGGGWSPELGVARPKRMGGAESARGLSCGKKADARGMLAEVRGWRTVASYFLRPSRLRATLDIPLLSLPRASVAPAFYLVPPPGVAALWEQDSWNAVGTAPHLPGGPPPGPGAHPHPTRSLQLGSSELPAEGSHSPQFGL